MLLWTWYYTKGWSIIIGYATAWLISFSIISGVDKGRSGEYDNLVIIIRKIPYSTSFGGELIPFVSIKSVPSGQIKS